MLRAQASEPIYFYNNSETLVYFGRSEYIYIVFSISRQIM